MIQRDDVQYVFRNGMSTVWLLHHAPKEGGVETNAENWDAATVRCTEYASA